MRRLWKRQRNATFREVRAVLGRMAPGVEHCMYCENSEATDIDHFRPKHRFPRLAFRWDNYLLACSRCNSNFKRDQFPREPLTGRRLLLDPTQDVPRRHLTLSPSTGLYAPRTPRGAASIDVFGLNRETLVTGRRLAWHAVQALIVAYARSRAKHDVQAATHYQETLCRFPHASVFEALLDAARRPAGQQHLEPVCLRALQQHPEIASWV